MIKTLAIETSCDDTSIGIVTWDGSRFEVEKLLAYSQVDDHQRFGGVVPEIASRLHSEKIIKVLEWIGRDTVATVDCISVTNHPWLPGSLVVGKAAGHLLAERFHKPIIPVNHIHGHILSLLLERNINDIVFPMTVLTASGGHNDLYVVENISDITLDSGSNTTRPEWHLPFSITKLGGTLDDAAGECFDKVSRMLGGPYPGGVWIWEQAEKWNQLSLTTKVQWHEDIHFKRIFLSADGFDFSFSWMKSQVSILLKNLEEQNIPLTEDLIACIAYEFQEAVVEVLANKLIKAWLKYGAKTLGISGGVSANDRLFAYVEESLQAKKLKDRNMVAEKVIRPTKKVYSTDNAAMIGVVGIFHHSI